LKPPHRYLYAGKDPVCSVRGGMTDGRSSAAA
jgi:hypothetical protein